MRVCVIPARGGSKRIPRKNIRPFCGRPMIAHSIETALESGCFDRVLVSTDDDEISEIARQWGAETPFARPVELADDHAGTNEVMAHALEWLDGNGFQVELACCVYATAPFLCAADLRAGLERMQDPTVVFAVSVTSFPFPVQRAVRVDDNGRVIMLWPEHEKSRSQDLIEAFHDAGAMYWGRPEAFIHGVSLFASHTAAVMLPRYRVQDIDTLEDWQRAELMYRAMMIKHEDS